MAKQVKRDTLVWGVILIVIGAVFLLESFDVDAWDYVWRLWPLILIFWGGSKIYYGLKDRAERPAPPAAREPGHEN